MEIELRACRAAELKRFLQTADAMGGQDVPDERVARFARIADPARLLGAFDGETMVGTAAAYRFTLAVPGGVVPAAGITEVGVLPTHRRRGILTGMMRRQLDDVRAWGEPVAVLWASESSIYQRFGYGLATYAAAIDVERDRAAFRDAAPSVGRTRMLDVGEALEILPAVYERVRAWTPGFVERSRAWWEVHRLANPAERRGRMAQRAEFGAAERLDALFRTPRAPWTPDAF